MKLNIDFENLVMKMDEADAKAKKASANYNKLADEIKEQIEQKFKQLNDSRAKARLPILTPLDKTRMRKEREDASKLKDYYNQYDFWIKEVARISNLLQGLAAYTMLRQAHPKT